LKIHEDRSFKGTVSFEELQEMAKRRREIPEDSEREETHWLRRLRGSSYRVERSRFSYPSNAVNPAAVAEMTEIDKYDRAQ